MPLACYRRPLLERQRGVQLVDGFVYYFKETDIIAYQAGLSAMSDPGSEVSLGHADIVKVSPLLSRAVYTNRVLVRSLQDPGDYGLISQH